MATIFGKFGSGIAETILGTPDNDTISPLGGFDLVDGGAGLDTVVVLAGSNQFSVARKGNLVYVDTISSASGGGDQLRLRDVERISFTDSKLALDLDPTQSAGQAVLLIGAVMGREAVLSNKELMGVGIGLFDQGLSMLALSGLVMRLPIWTDLAGGNSSSHIANYLLTRAQGAAPSSEALAAAVATLDHGAEGEFLAQLAQSGTNISRVDLVGIAQHGLGFV
ncbi:MAG: hypothetical protein CFE44_17570 [Burkholderiales bacterium PBB4]|nr:MAG: hypothetical protein CFE44_17570 [Burkholderiales bacterium PBB4]